MSLLKRNQEVLIPQLCVAKTFRERLQGLLGTQSLNPNHGIWIQKCRSIHTLFMKYSIDCVFIDDQFEIKSLHRNIKPWRLTVFSWKATSVIELAAGQIDRFNLKVGEVLHVGN